MDEAKIRQIAREEVQKAQMSSFTGGNPINSGVPYVAPHTHDGVNNLQVNQKNLIHNNKYGAWVIASPGGTIAQNTLVITGVSNPNMLTFKGIGYYSTAKAMITGEAQLGNCFQETPTNTLQVIKKNFMQTNSNVEYDGGGIYVNADALHLAAVYDSSGTLQGSIDITAWTNTSITIVATMTLWTIQGSIFIT